MASDRVERWVRIMERTTQEDRTMVEETGDRLRAVIFDLDGTICDIEHRRVHIVPPDPKPAGWRKDWNAFRHGIPGDTPNRAVEFVYRAIAALIEKEGIGGLTPRETRILFVSGRYEKDRRASVEWLVNHGFVGSGLFMRPDGDNREDSIIKTEIYRTCIEPYYDVVVAFDDRDRVVAAWRALGVPCFQVAEGAF